MIKRTIKETVREYDVDGNLVKETVTETTEDDNTIYYPPYTPLQYQPWYVNTCDAKQTNITQ